MIPRPPIRARRSRLARRAAPAFLAVAACLAAPLPAVAQDAATGAGEGAAAGPTGPSVAEAPPVPADWTRYVDPDARFTIDVPPGVLVQRADAGWYVQLLNPDGSVGLPGLAIYPEPAATIEAAMEGFPPDARREEVPLGPGTTGVRVVATYETMAAGRYEAASYLVPFDGGVYRLVGWEDLAWEPFERVARSFALTEPVEAR